MDKSEVLNKLSKDLKVEVLIVPNKLLDYDNLESEYEKNRLLTGMTVSFLNDKLPKLIIKKETFEALSSMELYQTMLYHCRHFEEVHRITLR